MLSSLEGSQHCFESDQQIGSRIGQQIGSIIRIYRKGLDRVLLEREIKFWVSEFFGGRRELLHASQQRIISVLEYVGRRDLSPANIIPAPVECIMQHIDRSL
jgi:hypothetical protein